MALLVYGNEATKQATFAFNKYFDAQFGVGAAGLLARAWCEINQQYYDIWLESGSKEDCEYSDEDFESRPRVPELLAIMDELPLAHPAVAQGWDILDWRPATPHDD